MESSLAGKLLRFACVAVMATTSFVPASRSQGGMPNQTQLGQSGGTMTDQLQYGVMEHQVARDEDAAYKVFLKEPEPAKKIQLGNSFLQKYPKSLYAERVDVGIMNAYRAQQDWKDTYSFADHALALQPDDVDVLTTVSWTIPHVYDPNDPNAAQELDTAEMYAKHAIEVLAKIPKPPELTEAQFVESKARRSFQAHSALGLVYFRREDYENSAKELELATKDNPKPDQTDLYVLGDDLQNLKRFGDAAEVFGRCAQIAGSLQVQCKTGEDGAKAQANQATMK